MQINDCIRDALISTYGIPAGQINDMLLEWYRSRVPAPAPTVWKFVLTVGNDGANQYGYQTVGTPHGSLVPDIIGGQIVTHFIADVSNGLVSLDASSSQVGGGVPILLVAFEGFLTYHTRLRWSADHNDYRTIHGDLAEFLKSKDGQAVNANIYDTPAVPMEFLPGQLNDAEYAFLLAEGATPGQLNDMWLEFLRGQGYTGSLNDMTFQFWCENAGVIT